MNLPRYTFSIGFGVPKILAKIAVGSPRYARIASGEGWSISDVMCTAGPRDRPYEELHTNPCIAVVASGTFQYRSGRKPDLMAPGSILLGNAGDCFTCGHEHGVGDRCVSLSYEPGWFEGIAQGARFRASSLPPIRATASLCARAAALLVSAEHGKCEEFAIQLGARVLTLEGGKRESSSAQPAPLSRVSRVIRAMENEPAAPTDLAGLARLARLSPYHFLRTFQTLTGVTPHQYLLRARLRRAAVRLLSEKRNIADIALDCGFGDVSNFNRAFKNEFGIAPRAYRRRG
jgi:AraC-like DNA-binding protein